MRISLLCLLFMMTIMIYSCSKDSTDRVPSDKDKPCTDTALFTPPAMLDGIPNPESYGKSASFTDISYSRPDTEKLLSLINRAKELATSKTASYDELAEAIDIADAEYEHFSTMLTYSAIKISANSTDEFYIAEYSLLTEAATRISDAVEELLVSAAASRHAKELEANIFGDGFIEEYSKERLTERVVELMSAEARLESEYRALSPTTVIIEYDGKLDDYQTTVSHIMSLYENDPAKLNTELTRCKRLYEKELLRRTKGIYIDLLRVRRLIADELGYDSYTDYAYETIYHDYSPEDMESFCNDVAKYAVPVMSSLDDKIFYNYFTKNQSPKISDAPLSSALGDVYRGFDTDLAGIYGFMEHYSLFDIQNGSNERDGGAYTTYLHAIDSPFIFMSASGSITDYAVLSHEFGHFYDSFINEGETASLELLELSSQALEFLTLDMMHDSLAECDFRYLLYHQMRDALSTLIYQSFYSSFEHAAYSLSYDEISEESLSRLVAESAEKMNLSKEYFNDLSYILTDQTVLYPHYSQAYAVSLIPALEIYFAEGESDGSGIMLYKHTVSRGTESDFLSKLESVSLSSPFDKGVIKFITDEIHFSILGYHYYKEFDLNDDAA